MSKYLSILLSAVLLTACSHSSHDDDAAPMEDAPAVEEAAEEAAAPAEEAVAEEPAEETAPEETASDEEAKKKLVDEPTAEEAEVEEISADASEGGAQYKAYSVEAVASASGQKYALFFHADWCPSCVKLEGDIKASLSDLPAETLVFSVDYDAETDLKNELKVLSQNTVVFYNADGTLAKQTMGASVDTIRGFFGS